eukprot:CAMPEP_0204206796 /NCGR_PEP_ID=MMETSP0361-20130328/71302_1 /ASSEMBLY_ACC=CAM_ASM_000343 /TAXON_ID=268821 /ORGANISM="Scrippsiella Hangoei, Strain SHTV-5" /LENGTH=61 /DNA_ID=CAMNT_0051170273 /DNA_START=77 /DNA_END=258 /DNA_ORIENTATION=-
MPAQARVVNPKHLQDLELLVERIAITFRPHTPVLGARIQMPSSTSAPQPAPSWPRCSTEHG